MVVRLNMFNRIRSFIAVLCVGTVLFISSNAIAESAVDEELMTVINYAEWEKQRLAYLPKIVVVDMWAMWCVSCIERFPEMVKLHEKYVDQNVEFVSMNLDDREDKKSLKLANQFLTKMNAKFDHYHMDENLLYSFEQIDLIGIPAVLIYDQKGDEQFRLSGDNPNKQFTEKDIEEAIVHLLNHT